MFLKILSYILPINILNQKSSINKSIEVTWNNGELVLDTLNTNYSYGSLQRILKKGLLEIGFDNIRKFQNILILGVAGGSVVKTLVDEIKFKNKIIGVEIDPEIIAVANKYFNLNEIKNLEIVIENAEIFIKKNNNKYDLIIIDIFQDNFMPEFLFESEFIQNIISILSNTGIILFNTMVLDKKNEQRNIDYINRYDNQKFKISKISNLEKLNELIIINKIEKF